MQLRFGPSYDTLDAPCMQTFLAGPTELTWTSLPKKEYPNNFRFYVHAPLNLNLAKFEYATFKLQKLVNEIRDHPATIVLHPGKVAGLKTDECLDVKFGTPAREAIETIAHRINTIFIPSTLSPHTLLFENAASQNSELCGSWDSMRLLYEALDKTAKLGLCLDTQHMFAANMCKFETFEDLVNIFQQTDDITGKLPIMFHLNDSEVCCGAHKDRHEELGKGKIWSLNKSTLCDLCTICMEEQIDMISETGHYETEKILLDSLLKPEK